MCFLRMQKYIVRKLSQDMKSRLIVIGVSAGAVDALKVVLNDVNDIETTSMVIVTHKKGSIDKLMDIYRKISTLKIKEAEDKETICERGHIYFAPPGYHLSVEEDYSFSLAIEEKVNFVRPSIDVLFKSAAEVYRERLTGIILTGANNDGAMGIKRVEELGGECIIQKPEEAFIDIMPKSAISEVHSPIIISLSEINELIKRGAY